MNTTLENVQVGDHVLWVGHYNKRILTVTRLTKTTIVCGYEKFRKSDGHTVPLDARNMSYIEVLTEEKRAQIHLGQKQNKLIQKCKQAPYHTFSIDILEEISNLIDKAEKQ